MRTIMMITSLHVFYAAVSIELARANSKTQHEQCLSKCFTITKPKRKK